MNCLYCKKQLTPNQVYEFSRGKSKGFCSRSCGQLHSKYGTIENQLKQNERTCIVCSKKFHLPPHRIQNICSQKCAGRLSSERMRLKNPMASIDTRNKVSKTLKKLKYKPYIIGGNGRGATIPQLLLYNELSKFDNSFTMEYIEKPGKENIIKYKCPNHYKIDIASNIHKIAIEIDGLSHNCLKIKECDKKKDMILNSLRWKVLRFTNFQIENELQNCVQTVMSMI